MIRSISLLLTTLLLTTGASAQANEDECTGSGLDVFGPGVHGFDNSAATTGTQGQNEVSCYKFSTSGIDNDIWFTYVPTVDGMATIDTCATTGTTDTKIAAYPCVGSGCPPDGSSLDCNDDTCGLYSQISFPVNAYEPYIVQIGNFPGVAGGTGTFTITESGSPPPPPPPPPTASFETPDFCDPFDAYAPGNLTAQANRWRPWFLNPAVGTAEVSTAQAFSGSQSLLVDGDDDVVSELRGVDSGRWRASAQWYIPSPLTGNSWFLLQNTYNVGGPVNWSSQIRATAATGMVEDLNSAGSVPIVFDQWVEVRVDFDLDNDTQSAYYDNQLLFTDTWTTHAGAGGVLELATVDLFSDGPGGNTGGFFDDVRVTRLPCESFDEYGTGRLVDQTPVWGPWFDDPAVDDALVSSAQAFSGSSSLLVDDDDDIVRRFSGITSGQWRASAKWYIPSPLTGNSWFLLQNTYNTGGPVDWSTQVRATGATGMVQDFDDASNALPIVFDRWAEVRVDFDLDADTQSVYYDNQLLFTDVWTNHAFPGMGGALELATVDLFSDGPGGNTGGFFDDVCVRKAPCSQVPDSVTPFGSTQIPCPSGFSVYRRYGVQSECAVPVGSDALVESVDFALQSNVAGPMNVRVYAIAPGVANPFTSGDLTLLHDEAVTIGSSSPGLFEHVYLPLCDPVAVPAGSDLVIELALPMSLFIGTSPPGGAPWFFSAAGCGQPIAQTAPGFPSLILDVTVTGSEPLGTSDPMCTPNLNSSGASSELILVGTGFAGDPLRATVVQGPPGDFGFFFTGQAGGGYFTSGNGQVCVFPFFRYNAFSHLYQFDASGISSSVAVGGATILETDGTHPLVQAFLPGETWYFQGWHRDCNTWNFSSSASVTFR